MMLSQDDWLRRWLPPDLEQDERRWRRAATLLTAAALAAGVAIVALCVCAAVAQTSGVLKWLGAG